MGIGNSHFSQKQNLEWNKANHAPSFKRSAILTAEEWKSDPKCFKVK